MFVWGSVLYFRIYTPPPNAMNIYVVGKQWMWKAEHPGGQHEINSLAHSNQPANPTDPDLAGRLPQFFNPCLSRQARGHTWPLHHCVV